MDRDKTKTTFTDAFIEKEQFRQKCSFFAFITTKTSIFLICLGLYEITTKRSNDLFGLAEMIVPFVLLFISYNRTRIYAKDVLSDKKNNKALFYKFLAKATKHVYKNPK